MAKAVTTIRQSLQYQPTHSRWFAATQVLFNQVAAFYFEVIGAHEGVLDLGNLEALTALEKLTHATRSNPRPVMPLSAISADVPAMFRRAAIHAALGSARSFSTHLSKWRRGREKAQAKGKKWTKRPPRPPRTWNNMILPMGTRLGVKGQSLDPNTYTREQTVGQIICDSGYQEVERDSSC